MGSKLQVVQAQCEEAGYTFGKFGKSELGWLRCSGFAKDPGFTGFALFGPCADEVCRIRLVATKDMTQTWVARTRAIALALGSQYGRPYRGFDGEFAACAQDPDRCMQDPDRRIEFEWQWADGRRITFVTKANLPHEPMTLLTYSQSPPRTRAVPAQPTGIPEDDAPATTASAPTAD